MSDRVELSVDIYFPAKGDGPFPVILARTPYDNMSDYLIDSAIFFAQNGYVFAAQDCRGRRDSDAGNPIADDDEIRIAHQTVYHDTTRPSHIILPVIPPS